MKKDDLPIVVFGGTGHYGSKIVKHLLERTEKVRVLSRNAGEAKFKVGGTVDIIEGDVNCKNAVVQSLADVKAVVISLSAVNPGLIKRIEAIEQNAVLTIMAEA